MNDKKNSDKNKLSEVSLDELETASGGCAACRGQATGSGAGSQAATLGLLTQSLAKK